MTTLPDVDLETIEEITSAAPCQYGARTGEPPKCPRPAEWVSFWTCGCVATCCDLHKGNVIGLARFTSPVCKDHTPTITDVTITHWEKL